MRRRRPAEWAAILVLTSAVVLAATWPNGYGGKFGSLVMERAQAFMAFGGAFGGDEAAPEATPRTEEEDLIGRR